MLYQEDDLQEKYPYYNSMVTEDTFVLADRQMAPRGTTPILEEAEDAWTHCPPDFDEDEYYELIGRGASREMIQQFDMEFHDNHGIGQSSC